jgi:hypothetical protein
MKTALALLAVIWILTSPLLVLSPTTFGQVINKSDISHAWPISISTIILNFSPQLY